VPRQAASLWAALPGSVVDARLSPVGLRGSAALRIRRPSVQIRDLLCQQYSSEVQQRGAVQRSVGTPNAALTCSTSVDDTPARGSGRRGSRLESCHPDQVFPHARGPHQNW
jgi:hypothetical protein